MLLVVSSIHLLLFLKYTYAYILKTFPSLKRLFFCIFTFIFIWCYNDYFVYAILCEFCDNHIVHVIFFHFPLCKRQLIFLTTFPWFALPRRCRISVAILYAVLPDLIAYNISLTANRHTFACGHIITVMYVCIYMNKLAVNKCLQY